MYMAFVDMYHVLLDLGLRKGRVWFWNFLGAPQICHLKKHQLNYKIIGARKKFKNQPSPLT